MTVSALSPGSSGHIEVEQPGDVTGAVTIVAVTKRTANTDYARVFALSGSDGNEKFSVVFGGGGALALLTTGNYVESGLTQVTTDGYCISAWRHGGTQGTTPRMSISKNGGAFTHANAGSGASSSASQAGGQAFIGCDIGSGVLRDFNPVKVAAVFVFIGKILTDGEIEGLLGGSPAEYEALTPTAFWLANVSPLLDGTAGDKDEITRAGVTLVDGDDPPSNVFVFVATPAAPANLSAPVVSGTPQVNETLSTTNGTWSGYPAPTFTYQWQRDDEGGGSWEDIDDETADEYVPVELDVDCMIRCVVTATNTEDSDTANSNTVGPVVLPPALQFSVRFTGGAANDDPALSLGGAESSESVTMSPGNSGLLRGVTGSEAGDGLVVYRCVSVHNDDSEDGAVVAYVSGQLAGAPQLALGVAVEAAGEEVDEIADEETAPSGVAFSEPSTVETGVNLGTIGPGDGKGLWLRQTIPVETSGDATNPWAVSLGVTPL